MTVEICWAQGAWVAWWVLELILATCQHGKKVVTRAWGTLITAAIQAAILYWGGFFWLPLRVIRNLF